MKAKAADSRTPHVYVSRRVRSLPTLVLLFLVLLIFSRRSFQALVSDEFDSKNAAAKAKHLLNPSAERRTDESTEWPERGSPTDTQTSSRRKAVPVVPPPEEPKQVGSQLSVVTDQADGVHQQPSLLKPGIVERETRALTKSESVDDEPRPLVIQGRYAYDEHPYNTSSFDDIRDSSRISWGDNVWHYGAPLVLDHSRVHYCVGDRNECIAKHAHATHVVHYQPGANDLYERDSFKRAHGDPWLLREMIANLSFPEPYLLVGIGNNGFFTEHRDHRLNGATHIEIGTKEYDLDPLGIELFRTLQERKQVAFLRGNFTNSLAHRHGFTMGIEAGCPTLLLNKDVRLGRTLQKRYEAVAARVGDRSLRVVISTVGGGFLPKFAIRLYHLYPNSLIVVQSEADLRVMKWNNVSFDRVRVFQADVPGWLDLLSQMDVKIGPRLHGSMAAYAATPPLPFFLIAPDYRVLELGYSMQLPMTDMYDERLQHPDFDVAQVIRDLQFDGEAFDRRRCELARLYVREFEKLGLFVARHIEQIAQIC